MKKFVDLEALNLRSKPIITPSTRIAILHLCQEVNVLGPDAAPGWLKVSATIGSATKTGVVKADIDGLPTLRDPAPAARELLAGEAIREWLRFEKGQGQEHLTPFHKFVGEMWKA